MLYHRHLVSFKQHNSLESLGGFTRYPLLDGAFIGREREPRGLFQVLMREGGCFYVSLTKPTAVYHRVAGGEDVDLMDDSILLTLPSSTYRLLSLDPILP